MPLLDIALNLAALAAVLLVRFMRPDFSVRHPAMVY
jgi:hypothetical protein